MSSTKSRVEKQLNELRQRHKNPVDEEATLERLRQKPKAPWESPSCKEMLRYDLVAEFDERRVAELQRATNNSPLLAYRGSCRTKLRVHHASGYTRVEGQEQGLFGKGFVYVINPRGDFLYLDPTDHVYLQVDADQVQQGPLEGGLKAEITATCDEEASKKKARRIEIEIQAPQNARMTVWALEDSSLSPYREDMFRLAVGCPQKLRQAGFPVDEIIRSGAIVRSEVFSESSDDRPITELSLEGITTQSLEAGLFGFDKSFSDLRDKPKSEGFTYGEPRRLSKLRPGRTGPQGDFDGGIAGFGDDPAGGGYSNDGATGHAHTGTGNFSIMRPTHFPRTELPKVCSCLPGTYSSQIANEFEQLLADDIKALVNTVATRLDSFIGTNGQIEIDWLDQFKASSDAKPGGDALYCLLRDEPNPASADPVEQIGGRGVLDKFVERSVRKLLVGLNSADVIAVPMPAGSFSLGGQVVVPGALATSVLAILGDASIDPGDRFDSLTGPEQRDLREAFLRQNFAEIDLNYPTSTTAQSVFHDLMKVKLNNIEFDIQINNTAILDTLTVGDNDIHLFIRLPNASGQAWMSRWPSTTYWVVLGLGVIGCIFAPALCALIPLAATVGTFLLLDFAYVSIDLANLEIDTHTSFTPNANGVLQPSTTFDLDADVSVTYASVVPTGVHQILSIIYTIVGTHTDIVINTIESQLASSFNELVRDDIGLSYPPQFGPVPLVGLNSQASGIDQDHLYLEAELNAGLLSVINPYVTQVDTNIRDPLLQLRDKLAPSWPSQFHHYGGFVFSQNFINHYIHILWRLGAYNYAFSAGETDRLIEAIKEVCPDCHLNVERVHAHLCPVVSPRLVMMPCGAERDEAYMMCIFDDLRLCFMALGKDKREPCVLELQFAAKAVAEIGFGGVNGDTGLLDVIKVTDRFMDIYFELDDPGVEVIHAKAKGHANFGGCFTAFDCKMMESMTSVLEQLTAAALASRVNTVIPRESGDPITWQNYYVPGGYLKFKFEVHRGNLYGHFGLGGNILLAFGSLLDTFDCAAGAAFRDLL